MKDTRALHENARAGAQLSSQRCKNAVAETGRLDKSGCGFGDLAANFERNAGLQFKQCKGVQDVMRMLELHSGRTSGGVGRPCVANLSAHVNCPAGRREFQGDHRTGCGGRHPLAPEFLFNAKRREGLAFGLVDLEGNDLPVCEEQLDPATYFDANGYFRVPRLDRACFWLCTSTEIRTPFDLPLTRPLQGTVLPGNDLMRLFLAEEQRAANLMAGNGNAADAADAPGAQVAIDQTAYNKLRSVMTRKDEWQRAQDQMMRNAIQSYDLMSSAAGPGGSGGLELDSVSESNGESNYTLRTVAMTERIATETDRLWTRVVQPWQTRTERALDEMQARLEKADRAEAKRRKTLERQEEREARALTPSLANQRSEMEGAGVGATEDEMDVDDGDVEALREEDSWEAFDVRRAAFQARLYAVKRDVTKYHCRLIKSCFLSTKDAATLPAGYKAMNASLEEGVRKRGGTASMAFHGKGHCLPQKDRQVWAGLQEWMRQLFVDDCKIEGRDRRIMVSGHTPRLSAHASA